MSELIDRQALLDECLNHYEVGNIEQNCTMDWICKTVRNFPADSPWHRVEEPPKEDGWYMLGFLSRWKNGSWWIPDFPDYWMTAEEALQYGMIDKVYRRENK